MKQETYAVQGAKSIVAGLSLALFGMLTAVCVLAAIAMLFSGDWSLMFLIIPAAGLAAAAGCAYGWALYGKA